MWRSTTFSEHEISDQSISDDDDDLNGDSLEDHVSLGVPAEKKGEVQILSQLDMLRDANKVMHERNQASLLQKRQANISIEDDVEFPFFAEGECPYTPRKASSFKLDDEILSDSEVRGNCTESGECFTSEVDNYQRRPNLGGNRKDGVCTWLAANAEGDALVNVNNNANCASFCIVTAKGKRSYKGGQSKAKRKFSFRTQSHNGNLFEDSSLVHESHPSIKGKEDSELKNYVMSDELPVSPSHATTSIAEHLLLRNNKTRSTSKQLPIMSHSNVDDDLDYLGSDSSDEDEENHQLQELMEPESKQKTIADQFQEALGAASMNEEGHMYAVPRQTGFGLFGKLQRVMQNEKETDSHFLNNLQTEDEASCFDVKILSKSLEAKLTVCSCSLIDNDERSIMTYRPLNMIKRKKLTIIFSSRISSDVELDVGTCVRVHPPWKDVNVNGKEEIIILSTYFSQI